jgi:DNA-binding NarL/FixJ family response regulator
VCARDDDRRRRRDPQASIEGILAEHPDVVVLDVQLVGGTGLQVLRAVRAAEPAIAFVVFSNNAGPAYRRRYLAEGAQRFLDKTTEIDQLVDAVEHVSHLTH